MKSIKSNNGDGKEKKENNDGNEKEENNDDKETKGKEKKEKNDDKGTNENAKKEKKEGSDDKETKEKEKKGKKKEKKKKQKKNEKNEKANASHAYTEDLRYVEEDAKALEKRKNKNKKKKKEDFLDLQEAAEQKKAILLQLLKEHESLVQAANSAEQSGEVIAPASIAVPLVPTSCGITPRSSIGSVAAAAAGFQGSRTASSTSFCSEGACGN